MVSGRVREADAHVRALDFSLFDTETVVVTMTIEEGMQFRQLKAHMHLEPWRPSAAWYVARWEEVPSVGEKSSASKRAIRVIEPPGCRHLDDGMLETLGATREAFPPAADSTSGSHNNQGQESLLILPLFDPKSCHLSTLLEFGAGSCAGIAQTALDSTPALVCGDIRC